MRKKMQAHLGSGNIKNQRELFHLKQDPGGVVDIEFMVQYAVLAWSNKQPSLIEYTDNIRLLDRLYELGILRADQVEILTGTYKLFRAIGHQLALQQKKSPVIDAGSYAEQRLQVQTIWQCLLANPND